MWGEKRYHSLNYELRKEFGHKVIKLSIDGGFNCPNRDGKKGIGGCIFCSSHGSGEYTFEKTLSIHKQMEKQIKFLSSKWTDTLYIPYFQNFSNTYGAIPLLRKKYDEALSFEKVVGLAIATRPDCIDEEVGKLLSEYKDKTYLWVELGIQTINEDTSLNINRGFNTAEIDHAFAILNHYQIPTVAHMIINLPGEDYQDYLKTMNYLFHKQIWGIKWHMLNILKGTPLEKAYQNNPFPLLSRDTYISLICDLIEILPPEVIIHRMTGDGRKDDLIAPAWIKNKRAVLNGIDRELKKRNSSQGKFFDQKAMLPTSS